MKLTGWGVLVGLAVILPLGCWAGNKPGWAAGLLLGEIIGTMSFIWVGITVRKGLAKAPAHINRFFLMQSLLRYIVITAMLILALQSGRYNLIGILLGYSLIQLPAACLRALAGKGESR